MPEWLQTEIRRCMIRLAVAGRPANWVWTRAPDERVAFFRRQLEDLVDEVRKYGAEVVLCTHATRFGERVLPGERGRMVAWRRFYPRASAACLLEMEARASEAVRAVAAKRGVALVDIAVFVPSKPEYFVDFAHFTDKGAEIAARALAGKVFEIDRRSRAQ